MSGERGREDVYKRQTYYGVPQENMDYLAESASELWPCIKKGDYIRNYSGILPKWVDENGVIQDFKIEMREMCIRDSPSEGSPDPCRRTRCSAVWR